VNAITLSKWIVMCLNLTLRMIDLPHALGVISMTDHLDQTIGTLRNKIAEHERAVLKIKTTINQLLELDGRPAMYADAELAPVSMNIRKDAFFGQPLATCVRLVLEARAAMNQGAATTDEIYNSLVAGDYDFEEKAEPLAKRNMAISLGKNTATFVRTPSGAWGLKEWYPSLKPKPKGASINGIGTVTPAATDTAEEDPLLK
jgi:hypothetical protein